MKQWVAYIATVMGVALFGISAFRGTDIAGLAPVEVVWLAEKGGEVYLETDDGNIGRGKDVRQVLADMKATAKGTIFLETADYLIVEAGQEELLEQVYDVFRPSCMVCVAEKMPDMEAATEFLTAHEPIVTLRQYRADQRELQILNEENGRLRWIE